jgi:hypothetical protein
MILAIAFCLIMPATIFADTLSNAADDWTVTYDGKNLSTNFKTSGVSASISGAMPGDTIQYVVNTQNNKSVNTDWYLSNSVVQSLEDTDGTNASDGAYSYKLSYVLNGDTTELYNSKVGGTTEDGVVSSGLKQVNITTDGNYIYLGRLSQGQSGQVILEITLDGNTQANDYMETIAQLKMNFAVEEAVNSVVTLNNTVTETAPGNIVYMQNTPKANTDVLTGPKTGDAILPMILSILGIVVGVLLVVIWAVNSRNRKTAKEEAIL